MPELPSERPDFPLESRGQAPDTDAPFRQHERWTCRLEAEVRLARASTGVMSLARNAGTGTGGALCTVVDCSHGGMGIETDVFLPRSCRVSVTVQIAAGEEPIEVEGSVQRVAMISRAPRYYLGLLFRMDGDAAPSAFARLIRHVTDGMKVSTGGVRP